MARFLKRVRDRLSQFGINTSSIYHGESFSAVETSVGLDTKQDIPSSVSLKHHHYPELNRFFIKFFNSASTSGRVNGENIALLTGAEGVGKTSYVEHNLQAFRKMKAQMRWKQPQLHRNKSPEYLEDQSKQKVFDNQHYLMFRYDFAQRPALNLQGFINHIEQDMITQILSLNQRIKGGYLCKEVIRQVVTAQNAQEHVFLYLKDVIYCMVYGTDPIQITTEEGIKELNIFNEAINQQQISPQDFFDLKYGELVSIVAKNINKSETQTALRIFLSAAKRIQYEHRPYTHMWGWYQTGIESFNFLFDILNFLCGLGALNKGLFQRYFFNQNGQGQQEGEGSQLVQVRQTNSWVKSGNRVDVGLILLNLDHLYFYDTPEFWKLIDHIIARTAHDTGLRTHFPVMIELPSSADLEEIHDMGQFSPACPIIVQLPGLMLHQMQLGNSNVSHLFTNKVIKKLFWRLGRVPAVWNQAIEEIAQGRATIESIIKGDAPYLKQQQIKVEAKFNSIFTQSRVMSHLYQKDARHQLAQYLRMLDKVNGIMALERPGYYIDFVTRPLFQALLRSNLAYLHYYLPYLDVANLPHTIALRQIKLSLIRHNRLGFLWWRWRNRKRFSIYRRQIRFQPRMEKERYDLDRFFNRRAEAHLAQTYYGARYNYIMHYHEQGISMQIGS